MVKWDDVMQHDTWFETLDSPCNFSWGHSHLPSDHTHSISSSPATPRHRTRQARLLLLKWDLKQVLPCPLSFSPSSFCPIRWRTAPRLKAQEDVSQVHGSWSRVDVLSLVPAPVLYLRIACPWNGNLKQAISIVASGTTRMRKLAPQRVRNWSSRIPIWTPFSNWIRSYNLTARISSRGRSIAFKDVRISFPCFSSLIDANCC